MAKLRNGQKHHVYSMSQYSYAQFLLFVFENHSHFEFWSCH